MRLAAWTIPPLLLLASCARSSAQDENKTDLQRDRLLGPVRSVTSTRLSEATKEQLKGISFGVPAGCAFCEYDRDGNKISDGRIIDGSFVGNRTEIHHNPDGMDGAHQDHCASAAPAGHVPGADDDLAGAGRPFR